jgi:hypothetical protein
VGELWPQPRMVQTARTTSAGSGRRHCRDKVTIAPHHSAPADARGFAKADQPALSSAWRSASRTPRRSKPCIFARSDSRTPTRRRSHAGRLVGRQHPRRLSQPQHPTGEIAAARSSVPLYGPPDLTQPLSDEKGVDPCYLSRSECRFVYASGLPWHLTHHPLEDLIGC